MPFAFCTYFQSYFHIMKYDDSRIPENNLDVIYLKKDAFENINIYTFSK